MEEPLWVTLPSCCRGVDSWKRGWRKTIESLLTFTPKLSSCRERRISRVRKFMRSHSCSATTWYGVLSSALPISSTMLNSSGSFSMISSSTARTWCGLTGCTFAIKMRSDSFAHSAYSSFFNRHYLKTLDTWNQRGDNDHRGATQEGQEIQYL